MPRGIKKGRIYPIEELLYEAEGAVNCHIKNCYGSMDMYLLDQNASVIGLTDIQVKLLRMLLARKTNQEIMKNFKHDVSYTEAEVN